MSTNFQKVKRKLLEDMKNTSQHTQKSWCDIMLRAANRCTTDDDQKDFFRFILNPNDSWDVTEPVFETIDPSKDVLIQKFQSMQLKEEEKQSDIQLENVVHTNGGTTYINVRQVECKSS